MTIYQVSKTVQRFDHDDWYKWMESEGLGYYSTEKGAKNLIDTLLNGKPNTIFIIEGYGRDVETEEYPLYNIIPIMVNE